MTKQMNKTFNIEDMETYFKNYVPCSFHKKQPITNFCTDFACNKYLCPQCVEQHSKVHASHQVQSIKTCILKTKAKLEETIKYLENQIIKNGFLSPQNHEQFTKKLISEMEEVKKGLIQQIEAYFKQKEAEVRRETSKYSQTQDNLQKLKIQLQTATKQLRSLKRGLFEPAKTVQVIERTNRINYKSMIQHFKKRISKIEKQMKIKIRIEMDPKIRSDFRISLNDLIGIKPRESQIVKKEEFHDSFLGSSVNSIKKDNYFDKLKNDYVISSQPLSGDRSANKKSILIEYPNYFTSSEHFLHFFQLSKSNLHIFKLFGLQRKNTAKWQIIPLNINFSIPAFHRTIATENGVIYVIGGTNEETILKSSKIYEYYPEERTLKPVADLKFSRSSHSITCYRGMIYIAGGMGDNGVLKQFQVFNPINKTIQALKSSKYPTVNSCLMALGPDSLLKLGGIFENGENNDHIELYNIKLGQWSEIDPVIEGVKGDFALLSCSGWAPLKNNQILVYGGYDEEADSQSSNSSYVIQYDSNQNQYSIKHINSKKLPIQEGFWSSQGIVYNNTIYALQNVNQGEEGECAEDKRNILVFDGKYWKVQYCD